MPVESLWSLDDFETYLRDRISCQNQSEERPPVHFSPEQNLCLASLLFAAKDLLLPRVKVRKVRNKNSFYEVPNLHYVSAEAWVMSPLHEPPPGRPCLPFVYCCDCLRLDYKKIRKVLLDGSFRFGFQKKKWTRVNLGGGYRLDRSRNTN